MKGIIAMVQFSKKIISLVMALVCAATMTVCFAGTAETASAKDIQTQTWDYLINAGCSPAAAAGIMGNIEQESSFNPRCGGSHKGLFQISRYHMRKLKKLAKRNGTKWYDVETQLEYGTKQMSAEIKTYTRYTWNSFRNLKSPAKAAKVWEKGVERAGCPMMANRIKYAKKYYKRFKDREVPKDSGEQVSGIKTKRPLIREL